MAEVACKTCGKKFQTIGATKYCSPRCREVGYAWKPRTRNCRACGREFRTTLALKHYCSEECRAPLLTCKQCGKQFRMLRIYADRGPRHGAFCSHACMRAANRGGVAKEDTTRTCARCGKTFSFVPSALRRGVNRTLCSKSCQKAARITLHCDLCGKPFWRLPSTVKGARFCSTACYRKSNLETSIERVVRVELERAGVQFVKQEKIGRWVVDFLVMGKWVVEADGEYWHASPKIRARDARRDAELASQGYVVVRLAERELKRDPSCVIRALLACGLTPSTICQPRQLSLAW